TSSGAGSGITRPRLCLTTTGSHRRAAKAWSRADRLKGMCTVIVRVPAEASEPLSFLAVRDEDPGRAWEPLGGWWPELPGVIGVRDRRAGGAWLAAEPDAGRLAVVLNREGSPDLPDNQILSRGRLPLDALGGIPVDE